MKSETTFFSAYVNVQNKIHLLLSDNIVRFYIKTISRRFKIISLVEWSFKTVHV